MTPPKPKPDIRKQNSSAAPTFSVNLPSTSPLEKEPRKLAPRPNYATAVFKLPLSEPPTQQPAQPPRANSADQHYQQNYYPPQHYYHPQYRYQHGPPELYFSPYYPPIPATYVWRTQFEHEARPYLNVDNTVVDEQTRQRLLSLACAGGAAIQSVVPREQSEEGARAHQGDGAGGVKAEEGARR